MKRSDGHENVTATVGDVVWQEASNWFDLVQE